MQRNKIKVKKNICEKEVKEIFKYLKKRELREAEKDSSGEKTQSKRCRKLKASKVW